MLEKNYIFQEKCIRKYVYVSELCKILGQNRQFGPKGGSLFDNSHKIFENDFFTEKHNDGNSTSNAKNNKCWKKYKNKFDNKV